jgi:serine/threonine protein kinase
MVAKSVRPQLEHIGRYEVLDILGEGGMGTVYRACDPKNGQHVAIKVIRPEWSADPVLCRRLEREFRAVSTLKHPHLVQGLDFGLEEASPYVVMEMVEGESLWARIHREGPLPEADAVRIMIQIAQALELVHQHNYVHRDIKPDNILLSTFGDAKLADLGLVKSLDGDVNLTQGGEIIGTPHYAAPEQFDTTGEVDARADIYGLGTTLYSAVTGTLPFQVRGKQNYLAILKKKLLNELNPPRKLIPGLSEEVDFAIRRATRADRRQRHSSCADFALALTGAVKAAAPPRERARRSDAAIRRTERRAAVRHETGLESKCEPLAFFREKCWQARIQDISLAGVRLILPRRFEPGTFLTVEIKSRDGHSMASHVVKVLRAQRDKPRQWSLGCTFLRPISAVELKALL